MLSLFVCTTLCLVRVNLAKPFHQFYTAVEETYEVDIQSSQLVFFFVQNTSTSVRITIGYGATVIQAEEPYVFALTQSARVNVTTSTNTSVIVIVDQDRNCITGSYYTGGGREVQVRGERFKSWFGRTCRYCLFSPSPEGQPVDVEFGLDDFSLTASDYVALVYRNSDGASDILTCPHNYTCTQRAINAYYYVTYQHGLYSKSEKLYYRRLNRDHEDGYTDCVTKSIPYYPSATVETPYWWTILGTYCHNDKEHDVMNIVAIVCGVLGAIGGATALIVIAVKTRCFTYCKHKSQDTINDSLMRDVDHPGGYPPATGGQPYPYQPRPGQTTVYA